MSSVCKHGNYVGGDECCGLCAGESQVAHGEMLRKARAIIERCGNPTNNGFGKYEWPDGTYAHCVAVAGEDNCYAEPGGAICPRCVEALLNLLEGK